MGTRRRRRPRPHADPHPARTYTCIRCGATAAGRFVTRRPHGSPLFNAPLWWADNTPNEVESTTRLCPVCRGLPHPLPLPDHRLCLDGANILVGERDQVLHGHDGIMLELETPDAYYVLGLLLTFDEVRALRRVLTSALINAETRRAGRAA